MVLSGNVSRSGAAARGSVLPEGRDGGGFRVATAAAGLRQWPSFGRDGTAAPGRSRGRRWEVGWAGRPERGAQASTEGAEPGSGRPADSAMNQTAAPPISEAAIM